MQKNTLRVLAARCHTDSCCPVIMECQENDVGVFGTGRGWPDGLVAAFMASLALWGSWHIVLSAAPELRSAGAGDAVLD